MTSPFKDTALVEQMVIHHIKTNLKSINEDKALFLSKRIPVHPKDRDNLFLKSTALIHIYLSLFGKELYTSVAAEKKEAFKEEREALVGGFLLYLKTHIFDLNSQVVNTQLAKYINEILVDFLNDPDVQQVYDVLHPDIQKLKIKLDLASSF